MHEMRIVDYKTGEELRDVGVSLTAEEAGALIDFLKRLVEQPAVPTVHLTEVSGVGFEREVAFHLEAGEEMPTVA